MKIRILRPFTYQDGPRNTRTLPAGVHDLEQELAQKVLRFGKAELVVVKKAPANKKRGEPPENKTRVAKPAVRSSSTGSKSKP